MPQSQLIDRLSKKTATVSIVGLGYVGLPLALRFVEVGYSVLGIDIDPLKATFFDEKRSYLSHIPDARVAAAIDAGLRMTTDLSEVAHQDIIIFCLPTPLNKNRAPDLSFILNTLEDVLPYLKAGQAICLESTTYPGTTEEELKPRLEKKGFTVGNDLFLIYSPEREDPANSDFTTSTIPKVCSGVTENCLEVAKVLYGSIVDEVVCVSSTRTAELTKLLENIHRAVNIGLVNEMKILADKMNIDIYEVIQAAATKPFGFVPYFPGPGLGGHCIPVDPFYLTWKAREYGMHTRFIELAGEINNGMPEWVVGKITNALNQANVSVKGSRILILGIAYKRNVGDMRESPAVKIMELLRDRGAVLDYSDPHVPVFPAMRHHQFDLKSIILTAEIVSSYDCVVLTTAHCNFDYAMIEKNAALIIDARGKFNRHAKNVVSA